MFALRKIWVFLLLLGLGLGLGTPFESFAQSSGHRTIRSKKSTRHTLKKPVRVTKKKAKKATRQALKRGQAEKRVRMPASRKVTKKSFKKPVRNRKQATRRIRNDTVSVKKTKNAREDQVIVMDDPAKPGAVKAKPVLRLDGEILEQEPERLPAEVNEAKAGRSDPAPLDTGVGAETREPDAFDLHTGSDPIREGQN